MRRKQQTDNHFITVSRAGELMARRKGGAPICVATAATGIAVVTDEGARAAGAPEMVRVHFESGRRNRVLLVTGVDVGDERLTVDGFLDRFRVTEEALGRWLRAAVEAALDRAASVAGST